MSLLLAELQFLDWQPVTMEVGAGEMACVRGGSGSGKSLLLRAIADLIPHSGKARLGACQREDLRAFEWRRRVGYLPAEIHWWEESVGDHFLNAPDVDKLAELDLDLGCFDWHPHRLSMGERQRLGLLRLFDRGPEALLLDEPTSNLDELTTTRVESLIFDYARVNMAPVIWVTHDEAQASRVGPRRYLMADKQLRAEAPQ